MFVVSLFCKCLSFVIFNIWIGFAPKKKATVKILTIPKWIDERHAEHELRHYIPNLLVQILWPGQNQYKDILLSY